MPLIIFSTSVNGQTFFPKANTVYVAILTT